MPKSYVVGIDIGFKGGISFIDIDSDELIVYPMPVRKIKKGKKVKQFIDEKAFVELIKSKSIVSVAFENIHAFKGQGVASSTLFGRQRGFIEGVLSALDISYKAIEPRAWQKFFDIETGNSKEGALEVCLDRYPEMKDQFFSKRGKHLDGLTDSVCIALCHKTCLKEMVNGCKRDLVSTR